MDLEHLFQQFVRDRRYLTGVSAKTVEWYCASWKAFRRTVGCDRLDKSVLTEFVAGLTESGTSPVSINTYARAINSFLGWAHENGHTPQRLRIPKLKEPERLMVTLSDEQLKALISWKPKRYYDWRLYALVSTVADSGMRINEALSLELVDLDFENLLISIRHAKGGKARVVPMSIELRKRLVAYLKKRTWPGTLLFCTREGGKIAYHNMARDFRALCKRLGISDVKTSFHVLRHSFATNYVRAFAKATGDGQNALFHLRQQLGHSSLETTRLYLHLTTDDLRAAHARVSVLNNLR